MGAADRDGLADGIVEARVGPDIVFKGPDAIGQVIRHAHLDAVRLVAGSFTNGFPATLVTYDGAGAAEKQNPVPPGHYYLTLATNTGPLATAHGQYTPGDYGEGIFLISGQSARQCPRFPTIWQATNKPTSVAVLEPLLGEALLNAQEIEAIREHAIPR